MTGGRAAATRQHRKEARTRSQAMAGFEESGFINVFKPVGMTSHDVVAWTRRTLRPQRVGHAGTLDPAACGVLVLLLNRATKLSHAVMTGRKQYRAEMTFGLSSDTGDVQGDVRRQPGPAITPDAITAVFPQFTGEITQTPPMTSARKVNGRPLYKLARQGIEIERPARRVVIHGLSLVDFNPDPARPHALVHIVCSHGTYVRTLVQDMAAALGASAITSFLMRAQSGDFTAADAVPINRITLENAPRLLQPITCLDNGGDSTLY